ncbi:hypothetical protein BH10PSE18_BH10PSE18_27890 [soil metagenome]
MDRLAEILGPGVHVVDRRPADLTELTRPTAWPSRRGEDAVSGYTQAGGLFHADNPEQANTRLKADQFRSLRKWAADELRMPDVRVFERRPDRGTLSALDKPALWSSQRGGFSGLTLKDGRFHVQTLEEAGKKLQADKYVLLRNWVGDNLGSPHVQVFERRPDRETLAALDGPAVWVSQKKQGGWSGSTLGEGLFHVDTLEQVGTKLAVDHHFISLRDWVSRQRDMSDVKVLYRRPDLATTEGPAVWPSIRDEGYTGSDRANKLFHVADPIGLKRKLAENITFRV